MYDAVTRNTYAELIKTAEAKMPAAVSSTLVKVATRIPAVRVALVRAVAQAAPAAPTVKEKH